MFGYTAADHSLNPKLLSAIVGNGGAAVAARDGAGELVGFAYGFVGFESGAPYLYSQAAFIDPAWQGKGVGRLLKQEQAFIARSEGLTSMRWAFDPTLARNAHFNLDVLGARGVRFAANYYDEPFSDRLIVDWSLASAAIGSATRPRAAASIPRASPSWIPPHWERRCPGTGVGRWATATSSTCRSRPTLPRRHSLPRSSRRCARPWRKPSPTSSSAATSPNPASGWTARAPHTCSSRPGPRRLRRASTRQLDDRGERGE
ncbi:GNAT family N-acetyltransferase [Cryobacterium breve]|uniref:GNAT family N-acetyltransferase n=1 Tax=Cryobacterium breve TaxID=1259258 RepID=A0ABY7NHC1_9MICO|nr:GNAT family N-acetyltransferase [Cryobacterium breve]